MQRFISCYNSEPIKILSFERVAYHTSVHKDYDTYELRKKVDVMNLIVFFEISKRNMNATRLPQRLLIESCRGQIFCIVIRIFSAPYPS